MEDEANTGETQQGEKQDEEVLSEELEEDSGFEGDDETEDEGQSTPDDGSGVAPLTAAPVLDTRRSGGIRGGDRWRRDPL